MLRKKATLFFLYFKLVFGIYKLAAGNTIILEKIWKIFLSANIFAKRDSNVFFTHEVQGNLKESPFLLIQTLRQLGPLFPEVKNYVLCITQNKVAMMIMMVCC